MHSLYIFDRHCSCIFYTPFPAPNPPFPLAEIMETSKLVYGIVFSLQNIVSKLESQPRTATFTLDSHAYKMHLLETPSKIRFVLLASPSENNIDTVLQAFYLTVWVEAVSKNALANSKSGLTNSPLFRESVTNFFRDV